MWIPAMSRELLQSRVIRDSDRLMQNSGEQWQKPPASTLTVLTTANMEPERWKSFTLTLDLSVLECIPTSQVSRGTQALSTSS